MLTMRKTEMILMKRKYIRTLIRKQIPSFIRAKWAYFEQKKNYFRLFLW